MREDQLRGYWLAYRDAWKLIKNHEQVTEQHISQMMEKHSNTVFNRLFCLVVWQEIARIRNENSPLDEKQYQKAFDEAWHLFKAFSEPNKSESYWNDLINEIERIDGDFKRSPFIIDLLINVTLEELERIYKEQVHS